MAGHLTETAINKATRETAAAGKQREMSDPGGRGLRLRLSPGGTRTWILGCRDRFGRPRRFTVGAYPALGLTEAREAARELREKVRKGADPIADARRDRAIGDAAKTGDGTLAAVVDLYGKTVGPEKKSWPHSRKRIDRVFAPLLPKLVAELTAGDLQLQADSYPRKQSAAFAVRTLRPVLGWAIRRGYCQKELVEIEQPVTVKRRHRVLSRAELADLLPVLHARDGAYLACLRFLLLTASRLGEATTARRRDMDLAAGTWTIPETKNGQPHVVPLSRQALALLRDRWDADGAPDDLVFASEAGTPLANWDRATKAAQDRSGVRGWHRHDLRRTAATMMGELGELPDIIEAALNHTSIRSQLAATYNRARYRPRVAVALQRLADDLDGIEAGAAAVIPLHGAEAALAG